MVERKRILTMFWYDDASEVHLYKDVGGIPYALAKYHGWEATLAYNDLQGIIHNDDYEQYVKLEPIHYPKICARLKLRYYKYLKVMYYVWKNAPHYDVINLFHVHRFIRFLCWLAKQANPSIITYVKCDMGTAGFVKEQKSSGGVQRWADTDLFTVEANWFISGLNNLTKYYRRIRYLPNGFYGDILDDNNILKERILLTVGRLGTYEKNTETLINAFERMLLEKELRDWNLCLVGPMDASFREFLKVKFDKNIDLRERVLVTGNISDKKILFDYYKRSSVFVLPSRIEGFPLVVPEAMHFACYPIVADCFGAAHEIILPEHGLLLKDNSVETLSDALLKTCTAYNETLRRGLRAKAFADKNLSWKHLTGKLIEYFQYK